MWFDLEVWKWEEHDAAKCFFEGISKVIGKELYHFHFLPKDYHKRWVFFAKLGMLIKNYQKEISYVISSE